MDRLIDEEAAHPDDVREPKLGFSRGLEGAREYFMGTADVQEAVLRLAARLDELGVGDAVAGGLAVTAHGHRRFTIPSNGVSSRKGSGS